VEITRTDVGATSVCGVIVLTTMRRSIIGEAGMVTNVVVGVTATVRVTVRTVLVVSTG